MTNEELFSDIENCLQKCKSHPGSVHNLDMDEWPLEMCVSSKDHLEQTMVDFLRGRMVIVMCSTLGNWSPRVPQFIADHCIVIYVKNYRRATKYGFRACAFKWGDAATWQNIKTEHASPSAAFSTATRNLW